MTDGKSTYAETIHLTSRAFNCLKIDDLHKTICKSSVKRQKLLDEAYWYQNLPDALQSYAPFLYAVDDDSTKACLTMEYYPHCDLAQTFVSGNKRNKFWLNCLTELFDLYENFRQYKTSYKKELLTYIYKEKTLKRLADIEQNNPSIAEMTKANSIIINGHKKANLPVLLPEIKHRINNLLKYRKLCVVHGDFCFSNILFDEKNIEFKLIDPRGRFEEQTIYGDPRYDMAKLRHSVVGLYDFMVAGKFELQNPVPDRYHIKIFTPQRYKKIALKFDELCCEFGYTLSDIKFIEALLFLTMIPLHYDDLLRQKAFYLTSILKFNEVFNE